MKTNKRTITFCLIAFTLLVIAYTSITYASQYLKIDLGKADDYVQSEISKKADHLGATPAVPNTDFYDECIKNAKSQDQKEKISALKADKSLGIGIWKRDALLIIGKLPNNQKRMTLDEAKQIVMSNKAIPDIIDMFNRSAGAPDFEGGSGISRTVYYTDETKKNAIYLVNDRFIYVTTDKSGKQVPTYIDGKAAPSPAETQPARN